MDSKRILFVEDDQNLGFVVKDQLESVGYIVDWEKSGRNGLKKALNEYFDKYPIFWRNYHQILINEHSRKNLNQFLI